MKTAPSVAVALIVHHAPLLRVEAVGAGQCLAILKAHPLVAVVPEGLTLPRLLRGVSVERFPASCFQSVRAYNRLMLSVEFYSRFRAYDYVLIHQLDAFVFRDELPFWCSRGYDYIGAPWLGMELPDKPEWRELLRDVVPPASFDAWKGRLRVGNGGLSLRRVETFERILRTRLDLLRVWEDRHEDAFWGIAARLALPETEYRVATEEEALGFAFETRPEECIRRLGRLPFGCHAWARMAPAFWQPWIRKAGWRIHVPGDGGWQDRVAAAVRFKPRTRAAYAEPLADVFYLFKENAARRRLLARLREGEPVGLSGEQLFGYAEQLWNERSVDCNLRRPRTTRLTEPLLAWRDRRVAARTGIGLGDRQSVRAHLKLMNRARVVLATNDNVGLPAARLKARGALKTRLIYVSIGLPERIKEVAARSVARAERYRRMLSAVDGFIAYGHAEAEWLKSWLGPAMPVTFLPFGVDTTQWHPIEGRAARWDVLSIGGDPMRDFGLLIEYARQRPALRIGWITRAVRRSDVGEVPPNVDVQIDLPIRQVMDAIAAAAVIALPVRENTYSGATTTLLQCMAMGKAAAVSRVGAIREGYGFLDGENLCWMEPGSFDSFSRVLDALTTDAARRSLLGAAARRHVETQLGWERYVAGLRKILDAEKTGQG